MNQQKSPAPNGSVALAELMFPSTTQCISVAARFRIADLLVDGPLAVSDLAEKSGAHPPALHKVLQLLTEDGIFTEIEQGRFANTDLSELLRPDVPGSLYAMARMVGEPWLWASWGSLAHSTATGEAGFQHAYGTNLWAWFAQNPDAGRLFNDAMTDFSEALSVPVVQAHPELAQAAVVADLGGGQGTFLATALETYPQIERGILVDLPTVIEEAKGRPELNSLAQAGRLEFAPVDFFDEVPAGVDVYLTKQIMHSWSDERLVQLLSNCRKASPQARILAAEMVQHKDVDRFVKNFNLTMLITMSGAIRSEADFTDLYRQAGYQLKRIIPTGTAFSLIEGLPQ